MTPTPRPLTPNELASIRERVQAVLMREYDEQMAKRTLYLGDTLIVDYSRVVLELDTTLMFDKKAIKP